MTLLALRRDGPEARALGAAKHPVEDFALNQPTHNRDISRARQQTQQPATGIEKIRSRLPHSHSGSIQRRFGNAQFFARQQFPDNKALAKGAGQRLGP